MLIPQLQQRILDWWNIHNDAKASSVYIAGHADIVFDGIRLNPYGSSNIEVHVKLVDAWRGPISFTTSNLEALVNALETGNAAIYYRHPYENYLEDVWKEHTKNVVKTHLYRYDGSYHSSPRDYCDY